MVDSIEAVNFILSKGFKIIHRTTKVCLFEKDGVEFYLALKVASFYKLYFNPLIDFSNLFSYPYVDMFEESFSSNLNRFPKKYNTGKTKIHYAMSIKFNNITELKKFLFSICEFDATNFLRNVDYSSFATSSLTNNQIDSILNITYIPERIKSNTFVYKRNIYLVNFLKQWYNYTCQICAIPIDLPSGDKYVEVHHLIPLEENGTDSLKNMICVCPNCHVKFHKGVFTWDFENKSLKNNLTNETVRLKIDHHLTR